MRNLRAIPPVLVMVLAGCAGGTTPDTPTPEPTATPTYPVEVVFFYDEDASGALDASEIARVPGVDLRLGGVSARSEGRTGIARLAAVPAGDFLPELVKLPPYYEPSGALPHIAVPASAPVPIALTLDIGGNRPNVYMAFGDSITAGQGSTSGAGYRDLLAARLRSHFGVARLLDEGLAGTRTGKGRERLGPCLADDRPAYTLILYGTNDWNDAACKSGDGCPTIANLQAMIRHAFATDSLPVIGTLPPANPTANPASRNEWVARTNDALRLMAAAEGAVIADVHAAFLAEPHLAALFADHIHPNDAGYAIIAREYFRAISGDPQAALEPAPAPERPEPSENGAPDLSLILPAPDAEDEAGDPLP